MKALMPCIWLDSVAEEAAEFYVALFENSKIKTKTYSPGSAEKVSGKKAGDILTVVIDINGQEIMLLNGGSEFPLSEAFSFVVMCRDQAELDNYWNKLTADGGQEGPCGWCKDKYGLSWQVVPEGMDDLIGSQGNEAGNKAMAAMLKMKKIDIAALERAAKS